MNDVSDKLNNQAKRDRKKAGQEICKGFTTQRHGYNLLDLSLKKKDQTTKKEKGKMFVFFHFW